MEHRMNLNDEPFSWVESGKKTIELRLNDPKRQLVQPGDTILFTHADDHKRMLEVRVIARLEYPSFEELFKHESIAACGMSPNYSVTDAMKVIREYYSERRESVYGVVGLQFVKMPTPIDSVQVSLGGFEHGRL